MQGKLNQVIDVLDGTTQDGALVEVLLGAKVREIYASLVYALSIENEDARYVARRFDELSHVAQIKFLACAELWDAIRIFKSNYFPNEQEHKSIVRQVRLIMSKALIDEGLGKIDETQFVLSQACANFTSPSGHALLRHLHGSEWARTTVPVCAETIALDFDSHLTRQNKPVSAVFGLPLLEWTLGEKVAVATKLDQAMSYMSACAPHLAHLVRSFVRRIFLRKSYAINGRGQSVGEFAVTSEHLTRYPGTIGISNPHIEENSVVKLMETLLHEAIHNFLDCYEIAHGTFMSSDEAYRPISPWSGNAIPNHSLCHAVFVYYACHSLFERSLALDVFRNEIIDHEVMTRLSYFSAGFLIERNLDDLFVLADPIKKDVMCAMKNMQKNIRAIYEKNIYGVYET